jgi:hypothetical protein
MENAVKRITACAHTLETPLLAANVEELRRLQDLKVVPYRNQNPG